MMRSIVRLAALALLAGLLLWLVPDRPMAGIGLPEEEEEAPAPRKERPSEERAGLPKSGVPPGERVPRAAAGLRRELKRLRAAEVVPRDATFFARVRDFSSFEGALKELAIAQMLLEPGVHGWAEGVLKTIRTTDVMLPGPLGLVQMTLAADVELEPLRSALRREVAVAGLSSKKGVVDLAFIAAVGHNREPVEEFLDSFTGGLLMKYPQFTSRRREHKGKAVRVLVSPSLEVSFGYVENLFIIVTGRGTLEKMIDVYLGGTSKQLAGFEPYRDAMDRLGKGSDVSYFADLGSVSGLAGAGGGLGLQGGRVAGAVRFEGRAVFERLEVESKELGGAISSELVSSPPKSAAFLSVDTVFYAAATADPQRALSGAKTGSFGPMIDALFAGFKTQHGVDIEHDILSPFGGEMAIGIEMPEGTPPQFLAVLEIRRGEAFGGVIRALEMLMSGKPKETGEEDARLTGSVLDKLAGGKLTKTRYRDFDIWVLEAGGTGKRPGVPAPGIAIARVESQCLVASGLDVIKKAIRQSRHGGSSITEKPDFSRAMRKFGPRRSALLYVDAPRIAEMVPALGPVGPARGAGLPGVLLDEVAKHLFGLGVSLGRRQDRLVAEFYGPIGPLTGGVLAGISRVRGGAVEHTEARKKEDQVNLGRIGIALQLYATDFNRFPMSLSELYPNYVPEREVFMAPTGKRLVRTKDDIDTKSDYVYVSGLKPTDLSDEIILFNKAYVHGGKGRNVLYLDGRVRFFAEDDFQDLLKRRKAGGLLKEGAKR